MANILLVHGSPRKGGNSSQLADAFTQGARDAGSTVTRVAVGRMSIKPCRACEYCFSHGGACVQKDDMQTLYPLMYAPDGPETLIYAFPLYTYSYPAQIKLFMDRMFCAVGAPGLFGFKRAGLLIAFGDDDPHTADGVVHSFQILANYCHYEYLGAVLAKSVYAKADIAGGPALEEARAFGARIS